MQRFDADRKRIANGYLEPRPHYQALRAVRHGSCHGARDAIAQITGTKKEILRPQVIR